MGCIILSNQKVFDMLNYLRRFLNSSKNIDDTFVFKISHFNNRNAFSVLGFEHSV